MSNPSKLSDLEPAVLALPMEARAELAHKLLQSLDEPTEAEFDRLWGEEAARRIAAGGEGIDGEVVMAEARKLLR